MSNFNSSIDLRLPLLPSTEKSVTREDLAALFNAVRTLHQELTKLTRIVCVFGETVLAGQAISVHSVAGVITARLANATDNTRACVGYSTYGVTSGNTGEIVVQGVNVNLTGLTLGSLYYLSITSGALTTTAPAVVGNIVQPIGYALTSTSLLYVPNNNWTQL